MTSETNPQEFDRALVAGEESPLPQEKPGAASGAVSRQTHDDPVTGRPLGEGRRDASSNVAGDHYRNPAERGVDTDPAQEAVGTPTSTPREEPSLDDLTR